MSAWERIPLEVQTPLTDAIRSGEIIVCASPEEIAERYPWFDDSDQSFVAAPLVAAGRVIGGIFIGSGEARQYGDNLNLIVSLARQAGQALDRAYLFERERASVGRLRKLQAVTAALSQAVTVEDVSRTCLEHATTGVGALAGLVVLRGHGEDAALDRVSIVSAIGLEGPDGEIPAAAEQPITASLRGGRPSSVDDGWIAFPLASGALALQLPSAAISDADREWLLTLVSQGEQALDRAGRYETERGIAETMQRSVLPERLPSVGGVTLAARYLPGTVGRRRRRRLVRHHPARGRLDRPRRRRRRRQGRAGRRDDGSASQRPPRVRLRVRRSSHRRLAARQARRGDDRLGIRDARVPRRRPTAAAGAVCRRGTSAAPDPLARRHHVVPRAGSLASDRRRRFARVRGGRGAAASRARRSCSTPTASSSVVARRSTRGCAGSPRRQRPARTTPRSSSSRCSER